MSNSPAGASPDDGRVHALLLARDELERHGLRLGVAQHAEDLVLRRAADEVRLVTLEVRTSSSSDKDPNIDFTVWDGWSYTESLNASKLSRVHVVCAYSF